MTKQRHFYIVLACGLLFAQQVLCQANTADYSKAATDAAIVHDGPVPNATTTESETTGTTHTNATETTPIGTTLNVSTNGTTPGHTTEPTGTTIAPTTSNVTESTANVTSATVPTTHANETTTAHTDITTPTIPPTIPPPKPGTWQLTGKNKHVCLMLKMNATFDNVDESSSVALSENAKVNLNESNCEVNNYTQLLQLDWDTYSLIFQFKLESDKKYFLEKLTFKNHTDHVLNNKTDFFKASEGKSYHCSTKNKQDMTENMTVTWSEVTVQAFMDSTDGKFGDAEDCSVDHTSDVVPIAVGCALAALVLVVLIAYLVGRRRSRQKGYQSV